MVDMIATKKLKYGTRRLTAGDPFEARHDRDARLLIGIGKARYATRDMVAVDGPAQQVAEPDSTPPSPRLPQLDHDGDGFAGGSTKQTGDDLPALRAAYQEKTGKRPFMGWSADVLRQKMADA